MQAHYYRVSHTPEVIDGRSAPYKIEHTYYIPNKGLIVCDSLESNGPGPWLNPRFTDNPEAIKTAEERISKHGIHTEGYDKPVTVSTFYDKLELPDELVDKIISSQKESEENAISLAALLQSLSPK